MKDTVIYKLEIITIKTYVTFSTLIKLNLSEKVL